MGTFINIYAPTGSQGERERNNLFSHELLPLINANKFPMLVGDWNCLTRKEDVDGGLDETEETSRRISEPLRVLLRDFGYLDAFLVRDSKRRGYTWHRRNRISSRLDRLYIHTSEIGTLVGQVEHFSHISDHDALTFSLQCSSITPKTALHQSSYWKLNKSIFNEKHFQVNFKDVLNDVLLLKPNYRSSSVWFDKVFKPSIRAFLMDFSRERSKSRRDTVSFFSVALQEAINPFTKQSVLVRHDVLHVPTFTASHRSKFTASHRSKA